MCFYTISSLCVVNMVLSTLLAKGELGNSFDHKGLMVTIIGDVSCHPENWHIDCP